MASSIERTIEYFALNPDQFRELEVKEKLNIIADVAHYWRTKKIEALEVSGKTRVDSVVEAQKYQANEVYWTQLNQNIKKVADLEVEELKRGIL